MPAIYYRPHSLAKQGDNVLGSVGPSIHQSAISCLNPHYQSKVSGVCLISWRMRIVAQMRSIDWLLIALGEQPYRLAVRVNKDRQTHKYMAPLLLTEVIIIFEIKTYRILV